MLLLFIYTYNWFKLNRSTKLHTPFTFRAWIWSSRSEAAKNCRRNWCKSAIQRNATVASVAPTVCPPTWEKKKGLVEGLVKFGFSCILNSKVFHVKQSLMYLTLPFPVSLIILHYQSAWDKCCSHTHRGKSPFRFQGVSFLLVSDIKPKPKTKLKPGNKQKNPSKP